MKNTQSMKKNHLFRRLYHKGRSAVSPYFAIYTLKNTNYYKSKPIKQSNTTTPSSPPLAPSCPNSAVPKKNLQPSRSAENILGITVSTKLGNAVVRNRIRRRISALYRTHEQEFHLGHQIVIVARNRCNTASYCQMEENFLKLMKQLNLLKSTPKANNVLEKEIKSTPKANNVLEKGIKSTPKTNNVLGGSNKN